MEENESQMIFECILCACKITKFKEVNYKILGRILAMPKLISWVHKEDNLYWCIWCGDEGSLEHILLNCVKTKEVHTWIQNEYDMPSVKQKHWIFGKSHQFWNPIIWVVNFALYKVHILACEGKVCPPVDLVQSKCARYADLFLCLNQDDTL